MRSLFKRKPNTSNKLIVLFAAKDPNPKLVEYLAMREDVVMRETFTTRGVIRGLPDADLVVIGDVISLWDVTEKLMRNTLESAGILFTSPDEMLARPEEWLASARLASRKKLEYLPSRFVLITGWAGGVGKSTLAIATARRFRERNLPTAFFEAGAGGSFLVAKLGPQLHTLYDVITGEQTPSEWEGVKIYPTDYRSSQVLSEDPRLPTFLGGLKSSYTLVVADASPDHPFWPRLIDLATNILVITAPRDDSLYQAETLIKELQPIRNARPDLKVDIVMNMMRTFGERIGTAGLVSATLPQNEGMATRLDSRLADPILDILYPGWMRGVELKALKKDIHVVEAAAASDQQAVPVAGADDLKEG
jgi:cellulose biosynthesis protein BcsQ